MDEKNVACIMGWCPPSRICDVCPFNKVKKADDDNTTKTTKGLKESALPFIMLSPDTLCQFWSDVESGRVSSAWSASLNPATGRRKAI